MHTRKMLGYLFSVILWLAVVCLPVVILYGKVNLVYEYVLGHIPGLEFSTFKWEFLSVVAVFLCFIWSVLLKTVRYINLFVVVDKVYNSIRKVGSSVIMDMSMDLFDDDSSVSVVKEAEISAFSFLTESMLVPKEGMYLGLDISESSTGVCTYVDGVKTSVNVYVELEKESVFREVLLRRKLKSKLQALFGGLSFDLIIIEDAFEGINPTTTRLLYALNTAIDELILDNIVSCDKFIRVNNKEWKRWLFSIDSQGIYKGYNDKERIRACLKMLGVEESGKGFQDRLDANGMLLGYFLCKEEIEKSYENKSKKKVSFSDIVCNYEEDDDLAVDPARGYSDGLNIRIVDESRWSKEKIINHVSMDPSAVYVTSSTVMLGRLGDALDLPYIEGGGYLAFWVKPNKVKKYI